MSYYHGQEHEADTPFVTEVKRLQALEAQVCGLYSEIDCRIEHGAESGGHLEYVRRELARILGLPVRVTRGLGRGRR